MMKQTGMALALALGMLSLPVAAQEQGAGTRSGGGGGGGGGQGWSVLGADTVGDGRLAIHGQAGFPGFNFDLLAGLGDRLDLGGRIGFNYAFEGWTTRIDTRPGLRFQALLHLNLLESRRVNLGLRFEPGFFTYFTRSTTDSAFTLPMGLVLGLPVSSALNAALSLDVPFFILWGNGPVGAFGGDGLYVPILFGAGLEYFIDRGLAATLQVKMGPTLLEGGGANFTLQTVVGIAARF
jgi:hypothetical protein